MASMQWLRSITDYWVAKESGKESGLELTLQGVDEVVGSIKDLDEAAAVAALGRLLCVSQHIPCKLYQVTCCTASCTQHSPERDTFHVTLSATMDRMCQQVEAETRMPAEPASLLIRLNNAYNDVQSPAAKKCARLTALERQDLSCTYLAHHQPESVIIIIAFFRNATGKCVNDWTGMLWLIFSSVLRPVLLNSICVCKLPKL